MRTRLFLLSIIAVVMTAHANDPTTKPIKPAPAAVPKEEVVASAPKKEPGAPTIETKSSKETKASEAARAKDAQASDEIALKIAEKLAAIRKNKGVAVGIGNRPYVRPSALPNRRGDTSHKEKSAHQGSAIHNTHWNYEGENGPQSWGKMNPANTKCDIGERQSPIDIREGIRVELDALHFDYKPVQFQVIDNGHTIQVNLNSGNSFSVSGRSYELVQFHFHRPSEERINGRGFEMVAHLLHKDRDGKLAVVAVLIEAGKDHKLIQTVWNNLPLEKNEAVKALSNMDMSQLLPTRRDYYTYMGSLTTPPCSEGVLWVVMKEAIEISAEQIDIFSRLYPMNARPLQKTSGRMIKESR
jgi:carbonic anhydrase